MARIIVADDQAVFRAGSARILAEADGLRIIAQCPDSSRLYHAVKSFRESIVIVACSMAVDLEQVLASAKAVGSRVIGIAENNDQLSQSVAVNLDGLVYRSVTSAGLIDCVRRVIRGERTIHLRRPNNDKVAIDQSGARVCDSLTPKELRICALILQGFRNQGIALRLNNSEQTIKNCLFRIYHKAGVSNRLELCAFIFSHQALAEVAMTSVRDMESCQGVDGAHNPRNIYRVEEKHQGQREFV